MAKQDQLEDRQQLEQAYAALVKHRGVMGEVIVDAALGSIREKLATRESLPEQQRSNPVPVLSPDVTRFTAISKTMEHKAVTIVKNTQFCSKQQ